MDAHAPSARQSERTFIHRQGFAFELSGNLNYNIKLLLHPFDEVISRFKEKLRIEGKIRIINRV